MPFGDGTGPRGLGPLTGHGAGFCAGYAVPEYTNFPYCGVFGGAGRGRRKRYYATGLRDWQRSGVGGATERAFVSALASRELKIEALKAHAGHIARTLDNIRKQIETLETEGSKTTE